MARKPTGWEMLDQARVQLSKAKTVKEIRQAQAVLLPLVYGFSMEKTAETIGVSLRWACQLRMSFIREGGMTKSGRNPRGGRRRENMAFAEERDFLAPFFKKASTGGILVVGEIKQALDARLGRNVALSSTYNLLHRHGWRKIAPDKRHVQANEEAQVDWKKNSPHSSPESITSGRGKVK